MSAEGKAGHGVSLLERVTRGLAEKVTFSRNLKNVREWTKRHMGGSIFDAEGKVSAKVLSEECIHCIHVFNKQTPVMLQWSQQGERSMRRGLRGWLAPAWSSILKIRWQ